MRISPPWIAICVLTLLAAACSGPPQQAAPATETAPAPGATDAPSANIEEIASSVAPTTAETKIIADLVGEKGEGEPVKGDWLVTRSPVDPTTLNVIHDTADAYAQRICMDKIFESLVMIDPRTLQATPHIAERWEISDDHLSYTFFLRKDVKFSDGTPLTAHDVKFTLDTIQNPANETADLRNYFQDITSCTAVDDYTVTYTCSKPYFRHMLMIGGLPIMPKHIYGVGNFNAHEYARKPLGSGPYLFEKWETNGVISLTRDPNYWNKEKQPNLEKLVWRILTDDQSGLEVFMRGDLDSIALTPEQWMSRGKTPEFEARANKFTTLSRPGYVGGYSYIAWNMRRPMFQDVRVRTALTMLLDRKTILETIFYGLGTVVTGPEFSGSPEYNSKVEPVPFDPARAQQLLTEAGWTDTDNDGVLDKDGQPFKFGYVIPSENTEYNNLATIFQEELKKAGIVMDVLPREWGSLIDSLTKRSFDAITLQWAIPIDSEPYQVWHSSQTETGSNYPGFKNAEADKLMEDIRVEFDRAKRIPMFHRFHEIVHEEQPYTFLFNIYTLGALDKRYRNVYVYAAGTEPSEWWVPLELQKYTSGAAVTALPAPAGAAQ
ncbi:MAG TPA: peptide-binding protein [Candidatus Hydrogenedentes bacterium]|nr:peptide-binding protein [Candidatus Hydrogenedentota bacterium]HRK33841.1 peptide-binding protein [Candidatus Hydrogenedentota bacterium]